MNWHARWRREFAHILSLHLQQFADIQAIAMLGSVACGYALATYHPKRTSCSPSPVHVAGTPHPRKLRNSAVTEPRWRTYGRSGHFHDRAARVDAGNG
jgi:hypothetical protein